MNVFQHQQLTILENTKRLAAGKATFLLSFRHSTHGYVRGCRCGVCTDAHRVHAREWNRRKKAIPPEKFRKTKAPSVAPFIPPRRVETHEEPVFAPPISPPRPRARPVLVIVPPPPPAPVVTSGAFKGSCKAVCAKTGWACCLPTHKGEHRHRRGPFTLVAAPGQTVFAARAIDAVAFATGDAETMYDKRGAAAEQREFRARRAHDGAETTTGLEGQKAYYERAKARANHG